MSSEHIELVRRVLSEKAAAAGRKIRLMEVCGSHSFAIARAGIRNLLPENVKLLSGPGCPVCVSGQNFISKVILLARAGVRVAVFGDLLRIPSPLGTPGAEKGLMVIYSPEEVLSYARAHKDESVVFAAVGFEPTQAAAAAMLDEAAEDGLDNFSILCDFKNIRPVLDRLCADSESPLDGFLLPGHVAAVTGVDWFRGLAVPGVISGFAPENILTSLAMLLELAAAKRREVVNNYPSSVTAEGSTGARELIRKYFEPADGEWRGLGVIPGGNRALRQKYSRFDAMNRFEVLKQPLPSAPDRGCRCGEVLTGRLAPEECPLYDKICTPEHPVGACMVSVEGACAASWYNRGRC